MKNFKFVLLVVILLAAIPAVFFAQIKRDSPSVKDQKEEVYESKRNNAISCGENYITVLTVTIAH